MLIETDNKSRFYATLERRVKMNVVSNNKELLNKLVRKIINCSLSKKEWSRAVKTVRKCIIKEASSYLANLDDPLSIKLTASDIKKESGHLAREILIELVSTTSGKPQQTIISKLQMSSQSFVRTFRTCKKFDFADITYLGFDTPDNEQLTSKSITHTCAIGQDHFKIREMSRKLYSQCVVQLPYGYACALTIQKIGHPDVMFTIARIPGHICVITIKTRPLIEAYNKYCGKQILMKNGESMALGYLYENIFSLSNYKWTDKAIEV